MKRAKALSIKRLIGLCNRIEDPRRVWGNKRHELTTILIIALLAIISGCESWEEICDYGKMKRTWLRTFLPLPNGIPSEPTFRRVFSRLAPEALEEVYRQWVWPYVGSCLNKQICVDGKTLCGVNRRSDARLHIVSAWVREDGIALGQIRTEEKSNEITASPRLLASLVRDNRCIRAIMQYQHIGREGDKHLLSRSVENLQHIEFSELFREIESLLN